jgi:hypothetical protein
MTQTSRISCSRTTKLVSMNYDPRGGGGELLFKIDGFVGLTLLITLVWGVQDRPWVLEISIQQRKKKYIHRQKNYCRGASPPKIANVCICPTVTHLYSTFSSS